MSKTGDLVKNTFIIAAGKLSTQFLSILLLPLYTAYLSTSDYGTIDLITTYVVLAVPLLTIQSEMAVFRFLVDVRGNDGEIRRMVTNALGIASLGVIAAIILFISISIFVDIPYGLLILSMVIVSIFSGFFMQVARGLGHNKIFAISGMIAGISSAVFSIVFLIGMGMAVDGVLGAAIIGNILATIYLIASLKVYRYVNWRLGDWSLKLRMLGYAGPLVPNGISWWLINAADRTIVTIVLGVSSNGVYAIAYKFPMIFNSLFSFFGMSWTESASLHINAPDRNEFFSKTISMSIRVFGSLGLLVIVASPFVFHLLINGSFVQAYNYVPVLILGAFMSSIVGLYSAVYIAKKLTKQVMNTSLIAAALSIAVTLLLINSIGLFAPAVAMVIAYSSMAIFRHYDLKKYVTITYDVRVFIFLILMYLFVTSVYYIDNFALNILSAAITVTTLLLYNKSVLKKSYFRIVSQGRSGGSK